GTASGELRFSSMAGDHSREPGWSLRTDRRPPLGEDQEPPVQGPGVDAAGVFRIRGKKSEKGRPGAFSQRSPAQASVVALVYVVGFHRRIEHASGGSGQKLDDPIVKNVVDHGPRAPTVDRLVNVPAVVGSRDVGDRVDGLRVLGVDRERPDAGGG